MVKDLNKYMKRCLTSLVIRAMQIKTTTRHHHKRTRKTKIKNTSPNRGYQGVGEGTTEGYRLMGTEFLFGTTKMF